VSGSPRRIAERPRLRLLATIHATIMLKRAAPNGAARDSIFCPAYEVTPRSAFVLWALHWTATAQRHEWNFPLDPRFAGRNRTGGQAIVAPRIAGGRQHRCQSTAAFRRESIGRLKAADKTASCRNERSLW